MKDEVLTFTENRTCSFNIGTLDVKNYEAEKIRNNFAKQLVSEINKARLNELEPVFKITEINN